MRPPNESRERQGNIGVSIRRPRQQIQTTEWDLTRTRHKRRFRNRRSNRRNETERINRPGLNSGFIRRLKTADQNRRIIPEASGHIRRFNLAARPQNKTAVSPILVKPREKPRAFSNGDLLGLCLIARV